MKKGAAVPILIGAMILSSCSSETKTGKDVTFVSEETTTVVETESTEGSTEETTTEATTEATTTETTEATTVEETEPEETELVIPEDCVIPEGYEFVWSDEFDGDELSSDWMKEFHKPGWVNSELQTYNEDEEYTYVKDGHLVIQPVKVEDDDGKVSYYSGRINSYHNAEFKYGYVEARIKTPEGQGFLPAFWMLPTTSDYGNWPSSGEIDIMEVVGGEEDTAYGTIHYGVPHEQKQGSYKLDSGRFCDDYHVFACEWQPGEISYYVDGEKYYTVNDWFSAAGKFEKEYPAPFNLKFYIILNVAVGGDWPGDPDENTPFDERAQMCVDYVRVYQKPEYDENVTKPEPQLNLSEPDETGNYVTGEWQFYELEGGKGSCKTGDEIVIKTDDEGTVDYSIQLVNEGLPLEEGETYAYTFEAKASDSRTIKTAITGPDRGYVRYMEDKTIDLTTEYRTYEFEFKMGDKTDDNARVEFNMGAAGSTADITIKNVRLEKK